MTEKRFKHYMGLICEKRDEEYYSFTVKEVCDLLNELSDENEQLKQQIQDMQIRFKRKYDYEFDEIVDELE